MNIQYSHENKPSNPLTVVAAQLSQTMRFRLLDGCYSQGSSTVLGSKATRAALRRRGLIAEDNRWTAMGMAVAAIARGGQDAGRVKTLDELHAMAQEEDRKRFPRALPDPTVAGPCQAQAHWTCTGQARGEHLNPLAMLPGSEVSADYVPMCQPCKDHLSDAYVTTLHS